MAIIRYYIVLCLKLAGLCVGLTFVGLLLAVIVFKWMPVTDTHFMRAQTTKAGVETAKQIWVPLSQISPELPLAVVSSEDNRFTKHNGFEWEAIAKAWDNNKKGRKVYGASTISQQTAKNVFLWKGKSWLRKGAEVVVTYMIELIWGKRRIMEVYLNVVEQGPGIFGAEASAQTYFHKHAKSLTRSEAALMAVVLPNPLRLKLSKPSQYVRSRQSQIVSLMGKIGKVEL